MHWVKKISVAAFAFALLGCEDQAKNFECETSPILFENFDGPDMSNADRLMSHPNYTLGADETDNYLISTYVSNEVGSERNTRQLELPPLQAATLTFDIWFEPDFDFVLGGKLPGFAPDTPAWGGESVEPNEWSNRIMWRTGGELITYSYHQNLPRKWGEDSDPVSETSLPTGEWIALSLYTDLDNGISEVWMNGEKISELNELDFHAPNETAPITQLAFHTFFGGNTPKWAPRDEDGNFKNLTARFDNIAVYRSQCIRRSTQKP